MPSQSIMLTIALAVGLTSVAFARFWEQNRQHPEPRPEPLEPPISLGNEITALLRAETIERSLEKALAAAKEIADERDEYKRIASTRDLPKKPQKGEFLTNLWDSRTYQSDIEANLARLKAELLETAKENEGGRFKVWFSLYANNGWWRIALENAQLRGEVPTKQGDRYVVMDAWSFSGTIEQILSEIELSLRTPRPRSGFPLCEEQTGQWIAPRDPISFVVRLSRFDQDEEKPVQIIEVLRTETRLVEIEKPIVIEREVSREIERLREPTVEEMELQVAACIETEMLSLKSYTPSQLDDEIRGLTLSRDLSTSERIHLATMKAMRRTMVGAEK
jgi:hypothetical protein